MANKDLNHYLSLPYTLVIKPMDDESGRYYYGTYLELDGCHSHGETVEELLTNLEEAKRGWLEVKLEHGDPIPEPQGNIAVRSTYACRSHYTGSLQYRRSSRG